MCCLLLLLMVLAQLQSRDESPRERMEAESAEDADGIIGLYHELSEELERTNQGVVALYAEIDDKSRQLREASEAKTRFMRNISHELRSPSNSIIGLARLLLDSGAKVAAAVVATRVSGLTWRAATVHRPPTQHPELRTIEAVTWAALAGATVELSKVLINRKAVQ